MAKEEIVVFLVENLGKFLEDDLRKSLTEDDFTDKEIQEALVEAKQRLSGAAPTAPSTPINLPESQKPPNSPAPSESSDEIPGLWFGRLSRSGFLTAAGIILLMELLLYPLLFSGGSTTEVGVAFIVYWGLIIPFSVRRLHDSGKSGWWCLMYPVPLINLFFYFGLLLRPGTPGTNKFGDPPPHNSKLTTAGICLFLVSLAVFVNSIGIFSNGGAKKPAYRGSKEHSIKEIERLIEEIEKDRIDTSGATHADASKGRSFEKLFCGRFEFVNGAAEALKTIKPLARNGDAQAQYCVARLYFNGPLIRNDKAKAASWFKKASDQGHTESQGYLANMYQEGIGVPADPVKSHHFFLLAAKSGDPYAQTTVAYLYQQGNGTQQDDEEALGWYSEAAHQGNAHAFVQLGSINLDGRAVKQDTARSYQWFYMASQRGVPEADEYVAHVKPYLKPERLALLKKNADEMLATLPRLPLDIKETGWGPKEKDVSRSSGEDPRALKEQVDAIIVKVNNNPNASADQKRAWIAEVEILQIKIDKAIADRTGSPRDIAGSLQLAMTMLQKGDVDGAERIATSVSRSDPNNPILHLVWGWIHALHGKGEESNKSFEKACSLGLSKACDRLPRIRKLVGRLNKEH